jgi:SAM-dependent methyltransferase
LPHERVIGLYQANAAAWDQERGRELVEAAWIDRFIALLPPGGEVLDVGCGSGEPIGGHLVARGLNVTGVDSSPSLIAMCRERLPDEEWLVCDMRKLELDRHFDGIIAWHSLFHLTRDDQRKVLRRLADHLKPTGALLFTSGPEEGERLGEWQGEPLYHASLSPRGYQALLASLGFVIVEKRLDDEECGGASVWLAQMRPARGLEGSA